MCFRKRSAALLALALITACSDRGALNPTAEKFNGAPQLIVNTDSDGVRISELHYDNTGTDTGERVEVSAPASQDLFGWKLVFYNGTGGAQYASIMLPFLGGTVCGTRKVVVLNGPSTGIQNGAPDGIALVDNNNAVIEFLSYEGTFTAADGPAAGLLSTDIGVAQVGTEAIGSSLQRVSYTNSWIATNGTNTFGACNDNGAPPPPPDVASVTVIPASASLDAGATQQFIAQARDENGALMPGVAFTWSSSAPAVATVTPTGLATAVMAGTADIIATAPNGAVGTATLTVDAAPPVTLPPVRFSELHYDNAGTDVGEAIEIEGPADTDLSNWKIVLYNGNDGAAYDTRVLSGAIAASCTNLTSRGIAYFEYPSNGIQNGAPDGMALVDASGAVVEFLSYEGSFTAADGPAAGMTSQDIGVAQNGAPLGQTLQRADDGSWHGPQAGSIGGCNSGGPINRANIISFSGRVPSDPALPVGFEDQLFASLIDPTTGQPVVTTFTWTSDDAAVASIDQDGVFRALGAGTAILRATAGDGTTATWSLPTRVATPGATAQYGNHVEFGTPADADASDDFLVTRPQYVISFNGNRGIPNWAAYNLDATHFGNEDRCDCFTYDPTLPFAGYTTANYTGASTFHGYAIDRGHLVRSFDREAGSLDNAVSFYFSNIVPQAADNNQGPWADLENELGSFAQSGSYEVYVIAGASGSKGTLKDEGRITIPEHMWKVAIVMPRDQGLGDVDSYDDVQVFAAIMPNDAGIRSQPWENYRTTVDAVEALSGYDLLALLPDAIEVVVESGNRPPVAVADGPYTGYEGAPLSFSASASSDPDGHALTFAWSFGDGATAGSASAMHTYAQDGTYNVRLIVADQLGLADTVFTTAMVANVAPSIAALGSAILLPGEIYSFTGSFTDPGADSWSASVDYGDGSGTAALVLNGNSFTLLHTYLSAGTFTVTVTVNDDDAAGVRTQQVSVLTVADALGNAIRLLEQLVADGKLDSGSANSLRAKLDAADAQLAQGNVATAASVLQAFLNELDAMVASGRVLEADVALLRSEVARMVRSLNSTEVERVRRPRKK